MSKPKRKRNFYFHGIVNPFVNTDGSIRFRKREDAPELTRVQRRRTERFCRQFSPVDTLHLTNLNQFTWPSA